MEAFLSGLVSFLLFHLTSRPKSKINKKYPSLKFRRFELFPRINFEAKNKIFHIHHWMYLAPILLITQTVGRGIHFLQSDVLNGFIIGGILQGLMYEDSFKFIHHTKEYKDKITSTTYHGFRFLKRLF